MKKFNLQQVLNQALEEFEEKFGESFYDLHYRFCPLVESEKTKGLQNTCTEYKQDIKNNILSWHTSILETFIEAEIEREEATKKEIFNEAEVGKVGTHAIASNQNFGYNQAKEETISHLKELLKR